MEIGIKSTVYFMYKISTVRRQKAGTSKDVINVETQRQLMSDVQMLTNCGQTCMQIWWAPITWNLFSKIKICSRRCFSTLSESEEADYHLSYFLTRPSVCHLMLSLFQDVSKIKYDNYEQEIVRWWHLFCWQEAFHGWHFSRHLIDLANPA